MSEPSSTGACNAGATSDLRRRRLRTGTIPVICLLAKEASGGAMQVVMRGCEEDKECGRVAACGCLDVRRRSRERVFKQTTKLRQTTVRGQQTNADRVSGGMQT